MNFRLRGGEPITPENKDCYTISSRGGAGDKDRDSTADRSSETKCSATTVDACKAAVAYTTGQAGSKAGGFWGGLVGTILGGFVGAFIVTFMVKTFAFQAKKTSAFGKGKETRY